LLSHMFTVAERWGLRPYESNPCRGLEKYPEPPRERLLSEVELQRLGSAIRQFEKAEGDWRTSGILRLLIFTGARKSEILQLKWDWVNWSEGYARLPRSKTGPRLLALPDQAISILELLKNSTLSNSNNYVFPAWRGSGHYIGLQKSWLIVRGLAGLNDVRIHDLRHCYASTAVSSGESLFTVGLILGHKQAATTQRYTHIGISALREVANRTSNKLAAQIST
jgi:integrase